MRNGWNRPSRRNPNLNLQYQQDNKLSSTIQKIIQRTRMERCSLYLAGIYNHNAIEYCMETQSTHQELHTKLV